MFSGHTKQPLVELPSELLGIIIQERAEISIPADNIVGAVQVTLLDYLDIQLPIDKCIEVATSILNLNLPKVNHYSRKLHILDTLINLDEIPVERVDELYDAFDNAIVEIETYIDDYLAFTPIVNNDYGWYEAEWKLGSFIINYYGDTRIINHVAQTYFEWDNEFSDWRRTTSKSNLMQLIHDGYKDMVK